MKRVITSERDLAARAACCALVQGVGPLTTAAALALMPELGTLEKGQAAAPPGGGLGEVSLPPPHSITPGEFWRPAKICCPAGRRARHAGCARSPIATA
jgi:hypothetical protein